MRSYVKDAWHFCKNHYELARLAIPRNVILDRSVRVTNPQCITTGSGVSIGRNVVLLSSDNGRIILGENVVLAENVILIAEGKGVIEVGAGTVIGSHVTMRTSNLIKIGLNNEIMQHTSIEPREAQECGILRTGNFVTIHTYNFLDTTGNITIGDETHTGPFCMLYTHNHNFARPGSIWEQGIRVNNIQLGSGIWMGSKTMIMPGSVVGDGSVIAAYSLVTREFENDQLLLGVPAKARKKRYEHGE